MVIDGECIDWTVAGLRGRWHDETEFNKEKGLEEKGNPWKHISD
jgi:hypothetical protein